MTKSPDTIGIGQLVPLLLQTHEGRPPNYRRVLEAAQQATIPASFSDGRWRVSPGDLPGIAEVFGMVPKAGGSDRIAAA